MRASRRFLNRPIQTHQTDAAEPFFAPAQQSGVQAESEDSFFDQAAPQPPKGESASGTVQTKLTVNAPGDKHEQEADAMADQVVQRMSAPEEEKDKVHKKGKPEEEDKVQRMSAPEEEKDKVHKKGKPEEEEPLQRKCAECKKEEGGQVQRQSDGSGTAPSGVTQQIKSSKGQGSKLSDDTRTQMESSFGTDFSHVTIHTDHESTEMNNALHAQAFTHGSDIYFNEGKYNPQNTEGGRLLAHELTHVVQQNGEIGRKKIQRNITTSLPSTATTDPLTGDASAAVNGFDIRLLSDSYGNPNGTETSIDFTWAWGTSGVSYETENGRITSFTAMQTPTATIQTRYGTDERSSNPSAYGRGTTTDDVAAGNTTLGFHESRHGQDYIDYITANLPPTFTGTVGMRVRSFRAAITAYNSACRRYVRALNRLSLINTDCVGTTIDQFRHTRQCPRPRRAGRTRRR